MSDSDYEKAEKKLTLKIEEKMLEIKEQQRQDRNDFNTKLATLKADVSEMRFDKLTHDFLKDKIYVEWTKQIDRIKQIEASNQELQKRLQEFSKRLSSSALLHDEHRNSSTSSEVESENEVAVETGSLERVRDSSNLGVLSGARNDSGRLYSKSKDNGSSN